MRKPDVTIIPILADNYAYIVRDTSGEAVAIVDPGDAVTVSKKIEELKLKPREIWLTHKHHDHIGGSTELSRRYDALIRGPREVPMLSGKISTVSDGDLFQFGSDSVSVREIPGHTRGHVIFKLKDLVFSGDVIFMAGCGRVFEGTAQSFYEGIVRVIEPLHDGTFLYPGHEYAERNFPFALSVDSDNPELPPAIARVKARRAAGMPCVPLELGMERKINPFLRVKDERMLAGLKDRYHDFPDVPAEVFSYLRRLRDNH